MIFSASRFVVVDDNEKHLRAIAQAFQQMGTPCMGIQWDPAEELNPEHFRGVRCLFLDLHLAGGQVGTDHKGDFARIQTILENNINDRGGPFVLVLWTQHPHLRDQLVAYLDANLDKSRPHVHPLAVLCLEKEKFIGADDQVTEVESLRCAVRSVVAEHPQLAALLGWETDVLASAADTLAELIKLIPAAERSSAEFPKALDTILSRLAREAVGRPHVAVDRRAAITTALAPILTDRVINQEVPAEMVELWSKAVTRHDDLSLPAASPTEAGGINRMLHLAIPGSETIRPTDWGAIVTWPYAWDDAELLSRMGLKTGEMLGGQFLIEKKDRARCKAILLRIGAACDYAQNRKGPITYLLGFEIPESAERKKKDDAGRDLRLPEAIWQSPVFLTTDSAEPFRLLVHIRFPISVLPDTAKDWTSCYRLREQLLMDILASASNYSSRPGIVQLPVD